MNEDLTFLRKHRGKGALVDANLLLVYVVGKTDRAELSRFQHTKQYADDFALVERLIESCQPIYTTPNVLTEVSNLGKKLGVKFFATLELVILLLDEQYCLSRDASKHDRFRLLGLTDAGLCTLAEERLVITADVTLYRILRGKNVDAVNFNHLRPLLWNQLLPSLI